jgi:uncharacterized membrane protein YcaP (DUF421 family)
MAIVLRGILVYFVLLFLFRISGKRIVNSETPFGLVLTLLISSSVADALKDDDHSITAGILLAVTLISTHLLMSILKRSNHILVKIIDDVPTLLVRDGEIFESILKKSKLNHEDILYAARQQQLTKINDIKYAVLEIDGSISIIPKESE